MLTLYKVRENKGFSTLDYLKYIEIFDHFTNYTKWTRIHFFTLLFNSIIAWSKELYLFFLLMNL